MRRYRRAAGLCIGLAVGFAYALVSQTINRLAMPGVPLYQPPLGPLGNTALGALAGAGLGLLCTWPDSMAQGILAGTAAAGVAIFLSIQLRIGAGSAATLAALVLSLPVAWVSLPIVALGRWLAGKQVEARKEAIPWLRRLVLPALLTVVVALLAGFARYGADVQARLQQMDAMVQAGLRAADVAGLPAPLRARGVDFPVGTRAGYTLEWTNTDLDRFIELRPANNYDQHAAVIARFAGGPMLVCIYSSPNAEPNCGTY